MSAEYDAWIKLSDGEIVELMTRYGIIINIIDSLKMEPVKNAGDTITFYNPNDENESHTLPLHYYGQLPLKEVIAQLEQNNYFEMYNSNPEDKKDTIELLGKLYFYKDDPNANVYYRIYD